MDIGFFDVPENELQKHCKFRFSKATSRRNLRLDQVMPIDDDLVYCAILSELQVKIGDEIYTCKDFDHFFNLVCLKRDPEALETARFKLQLLESSTALPSKVNSVLVDSSNNSQWVFIRCWEDPNIYCWKTYLSAYLSSDDLLDVLPHTFGEFEFFDEANTWYMRARDDDPFLFLAAPAKIVTELETKTGSHIMQLPKSFTYAF